MPVASNEAGVWVRVIAGEAIGVDAVIKTHTPIIYLHFVLQRGATHTQRVPIDFNAFAYLVEGEGRFGPDAEPAVEGDLVAFAPGGDVVTFANEGDVPLSMLLLGWPADTRVGGAL